VSDDRDNVRRRIQGDDDRALRSRVRTPAGGVAVDLDDPDTLRDLDRDPADLTPVGDVAARYSPELAGLLVEIERRLSYRVQQVTARAPLGDADRERLEGEIAALRQRLHDVERVSADAMGGHALHGQHDRSEFARVDAKINALVADIADVAQWQRDRDAKDEKARDGRWKLYASAASGLADGRGHGAVQLLTVSGGAGRIILHGEGAGAPSGAQPGAVGSTFVRTDGGPGASLYVKESGPANSRVGWASQTR